MAASPTTRNRAERRLASRKVRAAGAALTAGSAALAMGAVWIGTGVESAHAATTLTVKNLNDTGADSLRDAITNSAAGDTIVFQTGLTGTIMLGSQLPKITHALTITGPGASVVTVSGNDAHRIFYLAGNADAVTISGLTLTHGSAGGGNDGGAVWNQGDILTLSNDVITANTANFAGGVDSGDNNLDTPGAGSLVIESSVISGNTSASDGGGVDLYSNGLAAPTLTVNNSTFDGNVANFGGGLYVAGDVGAMTITNSTFSNNTASSYGGGLMVDDVATTSPFTLSGSTVSGNSAPAGGGISLDDPDGGVTIDSSTITGNHATDGLGGGIYGGGGQNGFEVTNTTISANTATKGGGGVAFGYQGSDINFTGTTISGNSAPIGAGAAIIDLTDGNRFATSVTASTISGNQASAGGGGFVEYGGSGVTITDSTISGNSGTGGGGGAFLFGVGGKSSVNNSTISGNTTSGSGGGVLFSGYYGLDLTQSTIAGNSAAKIGGVDMELPHTNAAALGIDSLRGANAHAHTKAVGSSGAHHKDDDQARGQGAHTRAAARAQGSIANTASLTGTILSQNTNGDLGSSGTATVSHSILGVVDPGTVLTDVGGNLMGVDPLLGPLASNGGPTQTMELLLGSPAINAGPDPVPSFTGNEFDQRGPGFARVVAGTVDIGAFEVQPPPIVIAPKFTG
jgi:hypothetical protein